MRTAPSPAATIKPPSGSANRIFARLPDPLRRFGESQFDLRPFQKGIRPGFRRRPADEIRRRLCRTREVYFTKASFKHGRIGRLLLPLRRTHERPRCELRKRPAERLCPEHRQLFAETPARVLRQNRQNILF